MSLELNCANVVDKKTEMEIPPKCGKKYPIKIGVEELKEKINSGKVEVIEIPVETGKNKELQEERY